MKNQTEYFIGFICLLIIALILFISISEAKYAKMEQWRKDCRLEKAVMCIISKDFGSKCNFDHCEKY
jgi:hypothetical protein